MPWSAVSWAQLTFWSCPADQHFLACQHFRSSFFSVAFFSGFLLILVIWLLTELYCICHCLLSVPKVHSNYLHMVGPLGCVEIGWLEVLWLGSWVAGWMGGLVACFQLSLLICFSQSPHKVNFRDEGQRLLSFLILFELSTRVLSAIVLSAVVGWAHGFYYFLEWVGARRKPRQLAGCKVFGEKIPQVWNSLSSESCTLYL